MEVGTVWVIEIDLLAAPRPHGVLAHKNSSIRFLRSYCGGFQAPSILHSYFFRSSLCSRRSKRILESWITELNKSL